MSKLRISLLFTLIIVLVSCGNGSETIPGLSNMLVKALKSGNEDALKKTYPSSDEIIYLYNTYYALDYPNAEKRENEAIGKATSLRLNLTEDFRVVRRQAGKLGINWKTATLENFHFLRGDHNQGFEMAEVKLTIADGDKRHDLVFDAYNVQGRWYLIDGLKWTGDVQDNLLAPREMPTERPIGN